MKKAAICLTLLPALFLFAGCGKTQPPPPELLDPVGIQIDTATVQRGQLRDAVIYDGHLLPYIEEVAFTVNGSLEETLVMTGDTVKKGQLLAKLDTQKLQGQIDSLQKQIADMQKSGAFSDRQLELDIAIAQKELSILEAEAVPPEETAEPESSAQVSREIEVKKIQIEQMTAKLSQQKKLRQTDLDYLYGQLDDLEQSLLHGELTAPISGQIVFIASQQPGASIKSYTTYICIADSTRAHLRCEYIEDGEIKQAQTLHALVQNQEYAIVNTPVDQKEYLAHILAGGNAYSLFEAVQDFGDAKSGQYAAVMLVKAYRPNALILPINALYHDQKGYYVYTVEGGTQMRQYITVGVLTEIQAEVLDGLQEGDRVYVKN